MFKIIIFASDLKYPNVQSFLFPFLKYKNFFASNGFFIEFKKINCDFQSETDFIFLESKAAVLYSIGNNISLIDLIKSLKAKANKIIFFDTSDSTEIEIPEVIPLVHRYCKAQILKNLKDYRNRFYGGRIFTNFAYKNFNIKDKKPRYSKKLTDNDLKKIKIFWNSSINNFGYDRNIYWLLFKLFKHKSLLKLPTRVFPPERNRENLISINFNLDYHRRSVGWFRQKSLKLLNEENIKRKNYFLYFKDLINTKYVLSPFGWGEINYRDYESFLTGCVLIKPNMDHLKTWPNYYQKGKFYLDYDWSFSNFNEIVENLESNYSDYIEYANYVQDYYISILQDNNLQKNILNRLNHILE